MADYNRPLNLVINLDRSESRLRDMVAQFAACNVDFTRVVAFDAKDLPLSLKDIHISADPMREFDMGTIACFLSHREAWRQLAESDREFGIIFEDDVVFGQNAARFLTKMDWFADETDIVKLETFNKVSIFTTKPTKAVGPYGLHRLLSTHLGGAAYAMRRELAQRLYDQTERIEWPVDKLLFDTRCMLNSSLRVQQAVPAPFTQSFLMPGQRQSAQSAIKSERDAYAPKGFNRFMVRQGRSIRKRFLLLSRPYFNMTGRQVKKIPFEFPPLVPSIEGISR